MTKISIFAEYLSRRRGRTAAGPAWARGLAAMTLAGAVVLASGWAQAAESVRVRLSYTPFAAHIPIYVAKAKKYYEENGIDVEILSGRGSTFAATTVGSGNEEFGVADPAAVVTARAKGIPVVAIVNLQQENGVALFAREDAGIEKVEDLKGRNIGMFTGSTTTIFLKALLSKHGMTLDDVKPVTVRFGTDLPLVLDKKIDAEVSVYNNELIGWGIEHPDLKLRYWHMKDLGFATPGYAIVTNETLLKEKPELVKGFARATAKGIAYAVDNPKEAVDILVKAEPTLKTNVEMAKWEATIDASVPPEGKKEIGKLDRGNWQTLNKILTTYDVIKSEVDLDALLKDSR